MLKIDKSKRIGEIGEAYVMLYLIKKGIKCRKVDLSFDLVTNNGKKIEVKTSKPRKYYKAKYKKEPNIYWGGSFYNSDTYYKKGLEERYCFDFLIFVCLNNDETFNKAYVIPRKEMIDNKRTSVYISKIPNNNNHWCETYREKWESIY